MSRSLAAWLLVLVAPLPLLFSQDGPVTPREAPLRMTVPEGFRVTLFAGEPDVVQPIAFCFDDRGRLWVAECLSYPKWHQDPKQGKDRVTIFEDRDGDGQFDVRKVFHANLANLSGIQYGFGGVWLCATPNLLFIPDRNGDDVPDGPPQVVLDGWDLKAQHNVFSSLTWGPDGWLYGCNGILSNSKVGKPGTPDDQRVRMNCGVWRYHPTHEKFEVVAHGTTNPWGLDFDDHGQMFITNCVIHHLWHVVPGAHFKRMFGEDLNPHAYGLMESVADHIHWAGGHWTSSRGGAGAHSDAGGGHAHSGAMIYLGDNWPARYRNGAFTCNIHGSRVNHDVLERRGSTYVARHGRDFLHAGDPWFRGIAIHAGPDGGVYVSDWTDTGECHNYQVAHKTTGRIYRIVHGETAPFRDDLRKLSDVELARRQLHRNDWQVRQARRLLQERAAQRKIDPQAIDALRKVVEEPVSVEARLRAVWALHVIGALDEAQLLRLFDREEPVRAWSVQLALEKGQPSPRVLARLQRLARGDRSPLVRLYVASGLQRVPTAERWPIAAELVRHQEDANDLYLPLMTWYAIEPLVASDTEVAMTLLANCEVPLVREYIARRLVSLGVENEATKAVVARLAKTDKPPEHRDVLRGIHAGLGGRRDAPMPPAWEAAYKVLSNSPLDEVRERCLSLALVFGDERAWQRLLAMAKDTKLQAASRQFALRTLVFKQRGELVPVLQELLDDPAVRPEALRGLAAFNSPETPAGVLKRYASWPDDVRADAVASLASRPAYALALLDAVAAGKVPRQDVGAFTVRQLLALRDKAVSERVEQVWGKVRATSEEKKAVLAKFKSSLGPDVLRKANVANGRALYVKNCGACHKLFGEGGDLGPELTGAQRSNLDYVLENVLDPSAIVPREHQTTVIVTQGGRVISGIVKRETEQSVTLQTQNETVVVPREDIESRSTSPTSIMPEGIFNVLRMDEVRDLVGYLASPVDQR